MEEREREDRARGRREREGREGAAERGGERHRRGHPQAAASHLALVDEAPSRRAAVSGTALRGFSGHDTAHIHCHAVAT